MNHIHLPLSSFDLVLFNLASIVGLQGLRI